MDTMSRPTIESSDWCKPILCECGKSVRRNIYAKHLNTKQHIDAITPKIPIVVAKLKQYNDNKNENNCCGRCLKINIPDCYYLPNQHLCICCNEISKGGEKCCRICKQNTSVELMERPYLYYCKKCAAARAAKPRLCECGATISLSTKHKHDHSKKHKINLEKQMLNKNDIVLAKEI